MGDRIRQKGENQVWAGGKVTIDRSDLAARGDSLWLRTGKDGKGSMIGGQPTLRGFGKDTFDLTGQRIDFTLDEKDLTGIMALDSAHAVTGDVDLIGDTVSIALKEKKAEATRAWGQKQRPVGLAGDYELRGDSLAIDTPKGILREVRAFFNAWAGTKPDSGTGERDWVAGDTVDHPVRRGRLGRARRPPRCGSSRRMDRARSFYRAIEQGQAADSTKKKPPSLNYARADRIVVQHGDHRRWRHGAGGPLRPCRRHPARAGHEAQGPVTCKPPTGLSTPADRCRPCRRTVTVATAVPKDGTAAHRRRVTAALVEGIGLSKSFRGRRVVDDVSVSLRQGEIVGLLGPNGAGKTTTFYLMVGLIRAETGRVVLDGTDISKWPMYKRARHGIGYLSQEPSVFRKLTVEENVRAILERRRLPKAEQAAVLERMLEELSISAPAEEPGVLAERRRAPPAGDHPGAGERAEVHAARRAVRRGGPDCSA